ncbi:MAG: ATP-binding cassette domain-containing protein [Oscillospiraceae bacterium]|nr:ATP-binding cassette domain-containing protein [Oscillospiraceae bacterium]
MITVSNLGLTYGSQKLFDRVDLQFVAGNCYGIIGANGAGKSTFLKLISGEIESTSGHVSIGADVRMSVLKQDQEMFNDYSVLETVLMGNAPLYQCGKEKDAIYEKEDFSDEDGLRAAELEEQFAELGGWEAESEISQMLQGLGIPIALHEKQMGELEGRQKVKVLLAQALFGRPDIVLLDEPTNNLDIDSVVWLEDFLLDYEGTVLVVAHDRYFLNTVCTHIVDIDFGKIKLYVGNYDFWHDSSQLMQKLMRDQNRKTEDKIQDLQEFIRRFSANKSKSRQATSRKKLLEKLTIEEMPASSRRYPWVGFKPEREVGKDILFVTEVSKTIDGVKLLDNISFILGKGDKVAFIGENENAISALFQLLAEELEPDAGEIKWGVTTSRAYFPRDNAAFFQDDINLVDWMRQFSEDKRESFVRQFLGRMLFAGDDVYKKVTVLSGGEKVRCMLSRMMLSGANVLLLDQPTNHLDMESIAALNNGLEAFPGNILFTTHDHQLIQTVANRIIEITAEGQLIDRKMTYDEYVAQRRQNEAAN